MNIFVYSVSVCYCFYYRTFSLGQTIQTFVHFTALRLSISIMRVTAACSTAVCIIIRLARPRAQGRVLVEGCVMSPCPRPVSAPRLSQCGPSPPSDAHSADRVNNLQPVQCCSAAGPDIAPSFVWLARPRPHRGLEGHGRVTSSLPPILGDYKQYRKV